MAITRASAARSPEATKTVMLNAVEKTIRKRVVRRNMDQVPRCPKEIEEINRPPRPPKRPTPRPGWTTPRTNKPLSFVLEDWINDESKHGYSFREDVLMGDEPDEDYDTKFPCDWAQVAKCLLSEMQGEMHLSQSNDPEVHKHFNINYYNDCKEALMEVREYYL